MDEVIQQATDPVVNYVFGAFALLLILIMCALLWYGLRGLRELFSLWRLDMKESAEQQAELSKAATVVIEQNANASVRLSGSLDELRQRLLTRPCLSNGVSSPTPREGA